MERPVTVVQITVGFNLPAPYCECALEVLVPEVQLHFLKITSFPGSEGISDLRVLFQGS